MKSRFRDVINNVQYEDLLKIRKDLERGGIHIKELVSQKILEREQDLTKVCATCGTQINRYFMDDYKLIFGRRDLKKQAYFCGLDCLRFFLKKIDTLETKDYLNPKNLK